MSIYHVSKQGCDRNDGSEKEPFATIQRAADLAVAGDEIVVHEGVYREWVKPENGGLSDSCRIVYQAAKGEHVVIKGSEQVTGWERVEGTVWKKCVPNAMFGGKNPYNEPLWGDWFLDPQDYTVHTGDVYMNGKSFYEAKSLDAVKNPVKRFISPHETWAGREEAILDPDQTLYQWYGEVGEDETVIYANFQDRNPNEELIEINVRRSCFYPEKTGVNYITVRGFEMAQAATPWAPPTANQPGMIGPNWSKGWIIEDNVFHDAKCSAVSLGKEGSTGDNDCTRWHRKPGYQNQMESVFRARNIGWSRERIGSHIVRNNRVYDCGQNGIVGHLGCIFSDIYGNEIYNIAVKHEYYGHEIAGIKLHAAIDVQIHDNYIHNCSLGTWLDWQAQGTRVSCNVFDSNNRDFFVEVSHGPYLVDHNIFASAFSFVNASQGGAYVHNLCGGFISQNPVLNRSTPYHLPHSTEVLGTALVYGSDDRWYQNIFVGGREPEYYGTKVYDGATLSMEEYIEKVCALGNGDVEQYEQIKQPAYIDGNVYLNGAEAFEKEGHFVKSSFDPRMKILTEGSEVYLELTLPEETDSMETVQITSEILGMARIPEARFENPDGSALTLNRDMLGHVRSMHPTAGPLEGLKPGVNRIRVWEKR